MDGQRKKAKVKTAPLWSLVSSIQQVYTNVPPKDLEHSIYLGGML
jgi:hypothetical protein